MIYRRAALQKWKQKLGSKATYNNLIHVFRSAGYQEYADTVYKLAYSLGGTRNTLTGQLV